MVFMTDEQRRRHSVRPGLTGLAQINGRNSVTWEEKIDWDLEYIKIIRFADDLKIVLLTAKKVFGRSESSAELDVKHDVETDVSRAFALAGIEQSTGHRGSYYVQAYLLKDKKNIDLLQKIKQMHSNF